MILINLFYLTHNTSVNMTNTLEYSNEALRGLLHNINEYESSLFQIILSHLIYQMKDSDELRGAVKLWLNKKSTAIKIYGHISLWDTSKVTDI